MADYDISKFRENGWVFLHGVLNIKDITIARQEIENFLTNSSNTTHTDYSEEYSNAFTNGIDLAKKSSTLRELVDNKIKPLADSLNDNRRTKYVRDQFFNKSNKTRHTPLHQDAYSLPYYCNNVYTLWIPLVEVKNYPLLLLDRSHCHKKPHIRPEKDREIKYSQSSTIGLKPGDISIHDGWLIHGTKPNMEVSNQKRSAWSIIFADEDELAHKKEHMFDSQVAKIDPDFLKVVKRTRNEIETRIY